MLKSCHIQFPIPSPLPYSAPCPFSPLVFCSRKMPYDLALTSPGALEPQTCLLHCSHLRARTAFPAMYVHLFPVFSATAIPRADWPRSHGRLGSICANLRSNLQIVIRPHSRIADRYGFFRYCRFTSFGPRTAVVVVVMVVYQEMRN